MTIARRSSVLCALIWILAIAPIAGAQTIRYVATTGADSGDCSAAPCRTIQRAVNQAAANDEVKIAAGVYTAPNYYGSSRQVVYISKGLTIRGGYLAGSWTTSNPSTNVTTIDAGYAHAIAPVSGVLSVGETITGGTSGVTATVAGIDGTRVRLTSESGSFVAGETVLGGTSGATAQVANTVTVTITSGTYAVGETITGATSGATGTVIDVTPGRLAVVPLSGTIQASETVIGGTSGATGTTIAVSLAFNSRGVTVKNASTVVLDGLHIVNGYGAYQASQSWGSADPGCSPRPGYLSAGKGGGICAKLSTLTILNSVIENNTATSSTIEQGFGGGVYADETALTMANTRVHNNEGNTSWWGRGAGVFVNSGSVDISQCTFSDNHGEGAAEGSALLMWNATGTVRTSLFSGNRSVEASSVVYFQSSQPLTLVGNTFTDNVGKGVFWGGTGGYKTPMTLRGNLFARNSLGIEIGTNGYGAIENNVFVGNGQTGADGGAIWVHSSLGISDPALTFKHNTIANTAGNSAIYIFSGTADFWNTIIAGSAIGVEIATTYVRRTTFHQTLFDSNTTDISGSPTSDAGHLNGSAVFAADGYHLTAASAALDSGLDAGVADDIDGAVPKRSQGRGPDLGADESPYSKPYTGAAFGLTKIASKPRLLTYWPAGASVPSHRIDQEFSLTLSNPTGASPVSAFSFTDALPGALDVSGEAHGSGLSFAQNGHQLTWQSTAALPGGSFAYASIVGRAGPEDARTTFVNNATGSYILGDGSTGPLSATASAYIPNFPPFITTPATGEYCLSPANQMEVAGIAVPGATIFVYQNETKQLEVEADANGKWTASYSPGTMTILPRTTVTITAKDCTGGTCGEESNAVRVWRSNFGFCAQQSYWEGTAGTTTVRFPFRNKNGTPSFSYFEIPGYYGFNGTTMRLYSCGCPDPFVTLTAEVWADGVRYLPTINGQWFEFRIGSAHEVRINTSCGEMLGFVLIDPDGFVYDSTKGFDAITPTAHALSGATVTCYVYIPSLGGWVVWPAQMYNDQRNPQVTGTDGYYSFLTPAGVYYLQVDPPGGFQSWRSPVVQVIANPVHVNIPLTPTISGTVPRFSVTPDGLNPTSMSLTPGGSVEWVSTLSSTAAPTDVFTYTRDPVLQMKSGTRDGTPVDATSPLGFDSGMLGPDRVYRRQFTTAGTYTFTDGAGHAGTVVVAAASAPTVTSIAPARGSTLGGSPVTITGTGFVAGATVTIGGAPAANVVVTSATTITAAIPPHGAGSVDVVVTNADAQQGTLSGGFAYVVGFPRFTDDPLVARTTSIRAVHMTELRDWTQQLRSRHGLSAFTWSEPTIVEGTTTVKASHVAELRTAIGEVFTALGQPTPTYTTTTLTVGATVVRAIDLTELRAAIIQVW